MTNLLELDGEYILNLQQITHVQIFSPDSVKIFFSGGDHVVLSGKGAKRFLEVARAD
jgi:hypothetical protein